MNLETELLEISNDNLSEAQFMASNFIDISVQNRVFFNVMGAETIINYLGKLGVDIENISSIHSIKRVVEKIDIADVILDNIHLDVRIVFDERKIFIPKSHYTLGIVPDIYAVLKYDRSFQRIDFIGFIEPSEINLNNSNDDYYFVEPDKLKTPFDMLDFINNFKGKTDKNLSEVQILRGRELSVAVADHDVTEDEFKEFIGLLVKSNVLRNSVLEYDNFETLAARVARALQISKSKKTSQNSVVDIDDFINVSDEKPEGAPTQTTDNIEAEQNPQDLNGDDLLDDMVDGSVKIAGAASTGAAIAAVGAATANTLGTDAVSKEAMDLAGIAGDVIEDATEELLNSGNDDAIEIAVGSNDSVNAVSQDVDDLVSDDVQELTDTQEVDAEIASKNAVDDENTVTIIDSDGVSEPVTDEMEAFDGPTSQEVVKDDEEIIEDLANSDDSDNPENMDLKEDELDFSDFDQNINSESFEDFITEEPTNDADIAVEDEHQTINESEDFEANVSESAAEQEPNDDSEKFDIGDGSIDNVDFSDISEEFTDNDYDFDSLNDETTSVEPTKDIELGEEPFEVDNKEEHSLLDSEKSEEALQDREKELPEGVISDAQEEILPNALDEVESMDIETSDIATFDIENTENIEFKDDVDNPFADSNEDDAESKKTVSTCDGEFTDVIESDFESVDDDLVIVQNESEKVALPETDNTKLDVDLEDISSANMGMELSAIVPPEKVISDSDNFEDAHNFEELPTEKVEESIDDNYGLINFSDLKTVPTPEPYNAEVNFGEVEDFADLETVSPIEPVNNTDYTVDNSVIDDLINNPTVCQNSVVISDKNHTPGEIFIDINKDTSQIGIISSNEHLEELYNKNNSVIPDDTGLNNGVRIASEKAKTIPLAVGIGGIALVVLIAGIILLSVSKFMNPNQNESEPIVTDNVPQNNNLGEDVPSINLDNNGVVMNDNQTQGSVSQVSFSDTSHEDNYSQANSVQPQLQHNSKPIPATSFLSVQKLSWEVPDYLSSDQNFRQYFQSAGKSLKASLSSDLLLATDYTYSNQIRVSILFDSEGTFQRSKILLSSGSLQVDNIVLQSVNQTLKVLKAPNSLGNDQSTTVILKIYL